MPPPVTARGSGGALIAAVFLLLRLFSMKFTVISNTYTSRDIRITRACMDSDERTVHSSHCYGSYCSAIKFVTQSFCEFVTEACTWPSKHQLHVGIISRNRRSKGLRGIRSLRNSMSIENVWTHSENCS